MFKFGSLGCKMLIIGLIVVLLAGVFGVVTGPPIREEIRTQLYHRWALEFEETWGCIDVIGITIFFDDTLEIYLTGGSYGNCVANAADAFYATGLSYLEKITEFWGANVDYVIILYGPETVVGTATELIITDTTNERSRFIPGYHTIPNRLRLWEGKGE